MIREPNFAHYPTNMKFPKPIQKQMKVVEGLTSSWAEEDAEYAAREHALAKAKTADGEALKAAAIAGEPDPGMKATEVAARAVVYQEERLKAAGRAVSKESGVLMTMFREHRVELFAEACEVAERTVKTFKEDIDEVSQRARQIEKARDAGLAPLRWVASLTDGNLSYDPSFPMQGSFQLPKMAEQKALGIVALLRRFYLEDEADVA
jgi:hypothetical protein